MWKATSILSLTNQKKKGAGLLIHTHDKGVWRRWDEQDLTSASQSTSISLTSHGKRNPRIVYSCYSNDIYPSFILLVLSFMMGLFSTRERAQMWLSFNNNW